MRIPMPPADALFLLADAPQRPMHVGALALLTPPDGADWQDVRRMMTAPMARERVATLFRRVSHRSLGSLGQWCWRTDGEVDLDYHVRLNAVPRLLPVAEIADDSVAQFADVESRGSRAG
jgi:hypothetical protein